MSKKIITYISIITIVIGTIFLANGLILAWTPPTQPPPDGNVDALLNVGSTGQIKSGGLLLNAGTDLDGSGTIECPNSNGDCEHADIGLIVDHGNVGIGTTDPSEKLEINGRIKDETGFVQPVGVINAYGGSAAPAGWLLCDGSAVSRTTYADLYVAIGDAYGEGDGVTTFHLPDLRGRFLRGTDSSAGRDPDAGSRTESNTGGNTGDNVGSVQGHAARMLNHSHDLGRISGGLFTAPGYPLSCPGSNYTGTTVGKCATYGWNHWHTRDMNLGTNPAETRPVNVNVNYIIKY